MALVRFRQLAILARKSPGDIDNRRRPLQVVETTRRSKGKTNVLKLRGELLCGRRQPEALGGLYFEPTIIECPRQDIRIVDTELFGPVLSVLRFTAEAAALGVDEFIYYASLGLGQKQQKRSLELFCKEAMPAFS